MVNGLLQELVGAQVEQRPGAPAIVWRGDTVTYEALEGASNQLARALKELGCGRGDRVCLLTPKSAAAVMAVLAIYKADCMCVPIDPELSTGRIVDILRSCEPRALLIGDCPAERLDAILHELASPDLLVGSLDEPVAGNTAATAFSLLDVAAMSTRRLPFRNRAASPANIFFVSGSSARAKGVVMTHAAAAHFVHWANQYFGMTPQDRRPGHAPLASDLSIYDIFGTFAAGGTLYPVPGEIAFNPTDLAAFTRAAALTQWLSAPAVLALMAQADVVQMHDFPALRRIAWCGEALPVPALRYWMRRLPQASFTNLYGATETTIASAYYTVPGGPDDLSVVPIGRACPGEQLYVLDENLAKTGPDQPGEIYIRGVGLSPGYWRDAEATLAAFVQTPHGLDNGDRMYRTGDLGRIDRDGLVYLVGRRDSQVSTRGHHVDLGEIETALHTLPSLRESAVVAIPATDLEEALVCCAYVPAAGRKVTPAALRRQLAQLLPAYMVPARWRAFERLPLEPSGKTDRYELQRFFVDAAVAH